MEDPSVTVNVEGEKKEERKWWGKPVKKVVNWLTHKDKDKWPKELRGNLFLVATVIATMTFQSALNPPGGVRPAKDGGGNVVCDDKIHPCPGESVLAYTDSDNYTYFLISNTTCFISSSAVCLLLVSGFPLDHRFISWLLSIGMCITISSLALTYMFGAQMVTPDPVWEESTSMFQNVFYIWIALLGLVALVLCLRLFAWILTKRISRPKQ
ncbi:uncharacterized protein HKW66_Vig0167600 [Vigna angularis]|uniref:PGG domain-containing protein n=2 Tax=Phaseolus angularis TaxID=3914 RepID=A0A8T0JQL2_PHAAN|nr:uncharacterized protein LOC108320204 [Vigna angularis]XP_017407058.1 uncharacterized protein LOC108320204 [Vigna angularis]KAG2379981.1 uncharacterized protein HKW66_Vig0167600 [Vigna angularis]BAT98340.1 hypothetical protein VIGAN_09198600 [Vigna angularis var. angularis]